MNRAVIIGLGAAAVLAGIVVIGLVAANGDDAGDQDAPPLAAVSPTATQPAVLPSATPSPGRTPAPPQATAPAPPSATPLPDSPVQSSPPAGPTGPGPGPTRVAPSPAPPGVGVRLEPAPIDKVDFLVLESFPPQYMVQILAGLPSGCARPHSHDVQRQGRTIEIRVWNQIEGEICTAIYGTYNLNLNLGSDFQAGTEYSVNINGRAYMLRTQ